MPNFQTWDRICKLHGWPQTFVDGIHRNGCRQGAEMGSLAPRKSTYVGGCRWSHRRRFHLSMLTGDCPKKPKLGTDPSAGWATTGATPGTSGRWTRPPGTGAPTAWIRSSGLGRRCRPCAECPGVIQGWPECTSRPTPHAAGGADTKPPPGPTAPAVGCPAPSSSRRTCHARADRVTTPDVRTRTAPCGPGSGCAASARPGSRSIAVLREPQAPRRAI